MNDLSKQKAGNGRYATASRSVRSTEQPAFHRSTQTKTPFNVKPRCSGVAANDRGAVSFTMYPSAYAEAPESTGGSMQNRDRPH
jgi:hypothetical protein